MPVRSAPGGGDQLEESSGHLGLDVVIGGRKTELIFDTGAPGVAVAERAVRKARLSDFGTFRSVGFGAGDPLENRTALADLEFGGLLLRDCTVALRPRSAPRVSGYDGVIGLGPLIDFLVTLDDLLLPVRVLGPGGEPVETVFILDTGAATAVLDRAIAGRVSPRTHRVGVDLRGATGKILDVRAAPDVTLESGAFRQPYAMMAVIDFCERHRLTGVTAAACSAGTRCSTSA